jgi:hypothetical protein
MQVRVPVHGVQPVGTDLYGGILRIQVITLVLAGVVLAAPAHADGDTSNLDQIIENLYNDVQARCTPTLHPQFQRIEWDSYPGQFGDEHYPTGAGGSGRIVDADPRLGGHFQAWWGLGPEAPAGYRVVPAQPNGYWDINLEFC